MGRGKRLKRIISNSSEDNPRRPGPNRKTISKCDSQKFKRLGRPPGSSRANGSNNVKDPDDRKVGHWENDDKLFVNIRDRKTVHSKENLSCNIISGSTNEITAKPNEENSKDVVQSVTTSATDCGHYEVHYGEYSFSNQTTFGDVDSSKVLMDQNCISGVSKKLDDVVTEKKTSLCEENDDLQHGYPKETTVYVDNSTDFQADCYFQAGENDRFNESDIGKDRSEELSRMGGRRSKRRICKLGVERDGGHTFPSRELSLATKYPLSKSMGSTSKLERPRKSTAKNGRYGADMGNSFSGKHCTDDSGSIFPNERISTRTYNMVHRLRSRPSDKKFQPRGWRSIADGRGMEMCIQALPKPTNRYIKKQSIRRRGGMKPNCHQSVGESSINELTNNNDARNSACRSASKNISITTIKASHDDCVTKGQRIKPHLNNSSIVTELHVNGVTNELSYKSLNQDPNVTLKNMKNQKQEYQQLPEEVQGRKVAKSSNGGRGRNGDKFSKFSSAQESEDNIFRDNGNDNFRKETKMSKYKVPAHESETGILKPNQFDYCEDDSVLAFLNSGGSCYTSVFRQLNASYEKQYGLSTAYWCQDIGLIL